LCTKNHNIKKCKKEKCSDGDLNPSRRSESPE
jgi:hypothetical protein